MLAVYMVYAHQLRVTIGQAVRDLELICQLIAPDEARNQILSPATLIEREAAPPQPSFRRSVNVSAVGGGNGVGPRDLAERPVPMADAVAVSFN